MMTTTEARARVERGAAMLDVQYPGWYKRIDQRVLDMEVSSCCVIGQVCGSYHKTFGRDAKTIDIWGTQVDPVQCGFALPNGVDDGYDRQEWSTLQETWLALITERLAADVDAPVVVWTERDKPFAADLAEEAELAEHHDWQRSRSLTEV
jgi:hypothetical protein